MTKETYLRFLKARLLNCVPAEDAEDIVRFYTEYFEDAGSEREAEVMAALGSPEELTAKIMEQRAQEEADGVRPGQAVARYTNSVFDSLPRWAQLTLLALAWVWLLPTVGGLLVTFGLGGIALIVCGACAVGIGVLYSGLGNTLLALGIALVLISIGVLLLQGANGFKQILRSAYERSRTILEEGGTAYETVF